MRYFSLNAPVIHIWSGSVKSRTIQFDAAKNQYQFEELNWIDYADAPPTIAEDGTVYHHTRGFRLHCVLRFRIYHPSYAPASPRTGFTEEDWRALDNARVQSGTYIEFYPHGGGGASVNPAHIVTVEKISSGRIGGNWAHEVVLKFEGVYVVSQRPADL